VWIARLGAGLPGASLSWPTTGTAITVVGLMSLLAGLVMTQLLARRWLVLLLATLMVLALARVPPQPGWPPAGWLMVACDVGQGGGGPRAPARRGETDPTQRPVRRRRRTAGRRLLAGPRPAPGAGSGRGGQLRRGERRQRRPARHGAGGAAAAHR